MRKRFHALLVAGLEEAAPPPAPLLICATHNNWWDGFVALMLDAYCLRGTGCLMQQEDHLRRYPFFTRLGVFGIDPGRPRAGLRHTLLRLSEKRDVWMFPQGRLTPADEPITVGPGFSFLARRSGCRILPLAIGYEWRMESNPTILCRAGGLLSPDTEPGALAGELERLQSRVRREAATAELAAYRAVIPPRLSLNKKWDRVRCFFKGETFDPVNK